MSRRQLQARYDQDTADQIEQFAEDKGISRSEALRRAARDKLRAEGYREIVVAEDNDDSDGRSWRSITVGEVGDNAEEYAEANISTAVRLVGGALIGLAAIVVLLSEIGLI